MDGCKIVHYFKLCSFESNYCLGWHDSFYWTLRDLILYDNVDMGRLKAGIDCRQQGFLGVINVINYIGNHDHDRMLVELGIR
jgi:1,4-alpha-glucan branching enzyme